MNRHLIRWLAGLFLLFPGFIFAASGHRKQTVCLNMIVKNESVVIRRCLNSIKPVIDYWVIVDTGSTDGTQEIVRECLSSIQGELYERPWRNFGENRTEALNLAKGKGHYLLFMDADDTLVFDNETKWPSLTKDVYMFWRGTEEFSYLKPQLVKGSLPWRWVGVTHEYLDCAKSCTSEVLNGVKYRSGAGGARSRDPQKFWKNVELLTEGLKKEPNNVRYMFYLAESYRDAGDKENALHWYRTRAAAGGWGEEIFCSKLQIGHLLRQTEHPIDEVIQSYQEAHRERPHRIEPIYYLAAVYNSEKRYSEAYSLLKMRQSTPIYKDTLFNEEWISQYGLSFQLAICSYYVGCYQESLDLCDQLLAMKNLPEIWRKMTKFNRTFPLAKLN